MKDLIGKDIKLIKRRDLRVEELIRIYRKHNNSNTLNLIIKKTEKLVYKIAESFRNNKIEQRDIQQVAFVGLLIAINRFDLRAKIKFSTFAVYCIKGEILHFIRDSKLIRVPRWVWKLNKMFLNFLKDFELHKNRYPTMEEISKGMNISIEGIIEFFKVREIAFYEYKPIDKYVKNGVDNGYSFDRSLIKSTEYRSFDLVMEDKILLWDAIDKLRGLDKKIIILSYFFGFSQKEIGKRVCISQKSVSRKLKESIKILKGYFAEN